jgi:hypothetical protein
MVLLIDGKRIQVQGGFFFLADPKIIAEVDAKPL